MAEKTWPRRRRYSFIWWGFNRKASMLYDFHSAVGFHRFTGWESRIWRWVVWIGPLNFYRGGTGRDK